MYDIKIKFLRESRLEKWLQKKNKWMLSMPRLLKGVFVCELLNRWELIAKRYLDSTRFILKGDVIILCKTQYLQYST